MLSVWLSLIAATAASCYISPITTHRNQFIDSTTRKPFYVRGVDYQPGGSSRDFTSSDPLSDPNSCARDIPLFQALGINAIRVYSVNPDLNHDECMTMLANAGIHLILDVNSPLQGQNINRYEPWTTYSPQYLSHIFRVIEQFSWYNNTMAYFMGNEIVNDERSASVAPNFIRAVTRDLKDYIRLNSPRFIPVGYSAADDLRYRMDLSHYLTCGSVESAVDFYGVNSYQWCGEQTFQTSGYDQLVRDHSQLPVPVFLSEFGCNLVQPRIFQEIEAIYSPMMIPVFSGGLVYEFTEEPNNYGLVKLDSLGNVRLMPDYWALVDKFQATQLKEEPPVVEDNISSSSHRPACQNEYENLVPINPTLAKIVDSFGTDMIRNGVNVKRGRLLTELEPRQSTFKVLDVDGGEWRQGTRAETGLVVQSSGGLVQQN